MMTWSDQILYYFAQNINSIFDNCSTLAVTDGRTTIDRIHLF